MDEQTVAQKIRKFFRDLFGSRLVDTLEQQILDVRADYERRMNERDETIAVLRSDLAQARGKLDQWELIIIPLTSPAANLFKPKKEQTFPPVIEPEPGSWNAVQADWYRKEADQAHQEETSSGLSGQGGQEVQQ